MSIIEKGLEKTAEDKKKEIVNAFNSRLEVLTIGFARRLREHPRAQTYMKELYNMLKTLISEYIIDGKIPEDKSPSKEQREGSVARTIEISERKENKIKERISS